MSNDKLMLVEHVGRLFQTTITYLHRFHLKVMIWIQDFNLYIHPLINPIAIELVDHGGGEHYIQ